MITQIAGKKLLPDFLCQLDIFLFQAKIIRHVTRNHDVKHNRRITYGVKVHEENTTLSVPYQISSVKISVTLAPGKILNLIPKAFSQFFILSNAQVILLTKEFQVSSDEEFFAL